MAINISEVSKTLVWLYCNVLFDVIVFCNAVVWWWIFAHFLGLVPIIYKEMLCGLQKTSINLLSGYTQTNWNKLSIPRYDTCYPALNAVPSSHVTLVFDDLAQCHSRIRRSTGNCDSFMWKTIKSIWYQLYFTISLRIQALEIKNTVWRLWISINWKQLV